MHVELKNINKSYGDFKASNNVNFQIEKGKLVALLGPSGSGKTTILRMIAGLETPDSGDIMINGVRVNDVKASNRGIGFVFQSYALFKYMTIFDNIAFGLKVQKKNKKYIEERVMELIKLIGLEGLENRYPSQLSGGQRQRVAFARALAPNPELLLLDEPFAAIDAKVRKELRSWLKEMIGKLGITSIFVTHDQDEAIEVADEIIITNHGQIEQKGSPLEIYRDPTSPFVAQFIGESTVIEDFKLNGFKLEGDNNKVIIRPEFIEVLKKDEWLKYKASAEEGVVEDISFRGSCLELTIKLNEMTLTASRTLEKTPIKVGESVNIIIHRLYVFDGNKVKLVNNPILEQQNYVFI